ncbi:MAG: hypothetical protein HKO89_00390, partial [Saprospiraceae bacterium]|nr:hypothetical protein [Saprospiraceae bacterium]
MSKNYLVPLLLLVTVVLLDVFSYRTNPLSDSVDQIESYIDGSLTAHSELILNSRNISLYNSDSLSLDDFNTIKRIESQLKTHGLRTRLYDGNKLIFWTNIEALDTICRNYKKGQYRLRICKSIITTTGKLHQDIKKNSLVKHKINLAGKEKKVDLSGIDFPADHDVHRPYRLNIVLISLYTLVFLLFVLLSLNLKSIYGLGFLVAIRVLMILSDWQDRFDTILVTHQLFDGYNYSPIDLLLDSIIVFGILVFICARKKTRQQVDKAQLFLNALLLGFLMISHIRMTQLLSYSDTVFTTFNDLSRIGINDIICIVSLLVVLAGIFIFGYSQFNELNKVKHSRTTNYLIYGGIAAFMAVLSVFIQLEINPVFLFVFLSLFFLLLDLFVDVMSKNITWVIWWGIFFGIYLSAVFFNFDIKKELEERKEFLENVIHDIPIDSIGAIRNSGIIDSIKNDVANLLTLPPEARYDKDDFDAFIRNKAGKDDISIEIFRDATYAIFKSSEYLKTKNYLLRIDENTEFDEINDIIWFNEILLESYILKIAYPLERDSFPKSFDFNYYRKAKLIHEDLRLTAAELQLLEEDKNDIVYSNSIAYVQNRTDDGKLLVTKKYFLGLVKPVALFSFIFGLIVVLSLLMSFSHSFIQYLPEDWPFKIQKFDSLNSKIQISLIMVILISFLIIAFITNSFLNNHISRDKDRYFRDKIESIANEIQYSIAVAQSSKEAITIARNFRERIENIHNVKMEIYGLERPGRNIDYFTHAYFTKQEEIQPFTDKSYNKHISYIPILFRDKAVGVSTIETTEAYFEHAYVYDFLGSIFNVYVFLFLIASVIAIFIARSITKPLALLNQKLLQLKLGKQNELIGWEKDDEIGNLISNYNHMVNQLEESANILAKTERDSAWREMAKQVAHEIKNPLTPMKLSIQYLGKAIKQNPEDAAKISNRISSTLLEQINNLTEIANAFSNFAELPQSSNVKIELNEVVELVHNLFRKREDMDIYLSVPIDPIYVYADKNQLIRILNNLVKNATEAIPNTRRGKIEMKLIVKDDKAIIRVRDNGIGIP